MTVISENVPFRNNKPLFLPCLAQSGTRIFTSTSDQRFLAGTDTFLRTHFPIQLQSHRAGNVINLSEKDILNRLLEPSPNVIGNQVMVLYGAAGSGKSELLRWLQTQINQQDVSRSEITIRISRTDLDIFHIAQRFQHLHKKQSFQDVTQQRWNECRQKPRTLAKILVLNALEQLLNSDDQINALYYQLIDVVQTNLEHCFAAMSQPAENIGSSIELFSREDLVDILRNSVVSVTIEYETLRYHILKAFRDQLLEGLDLPRTLKQIAQHIYEERGQRPILLIDDLVQSINLFATDLLDYFLTLEEGCWDVVIGVTPNSLDASLRGKEILERIAFLDTIDDRVQKLWLSDEYGLSSSFLNETNCIEYARLYLQEYKHQNQKFCDSSCPAFRKCNYLEPDRAENLLSPFNKEVLVRLFRSLPVGKGKVRYFTLYLRDILERITHGEELLTVLQQYVKSEQAAYHTNEQVAKIYELYGPFTSGNFLEEDHIYVSHLYRFFDIGDGEDRTQAPVVATLYKRHALEQESQQLSVVLHTMDPGKEAIKGWLQGDEINKQQLRTLRRGIIKVIKDGYLLDIMTPLHTAKPTRILRWAQTHQETVPPVKLEGVDEFDGLSISRSIGPLAYILHDFTDATGWTEQDLRSQLLNHRASPTVIFQAMTYRDRIHNELERQLGMAVEKLAFSLLVIAMQLGYSPLELPLSIRHRLGNETICPPKYPESVDMERPHLTSSQLSIIRRLFDDCFKLRENVYDGFVLATMVEEFEVNQTFTLFQEIDTSEIAVDFRLNEEPLGVLISELQNEMAKLVKLKMSHKVTLALNSVCRAGLGADADSLQLATLLGFPGNNESLITNFISRCSVFDLHKALCLAYLVDVVQYEHSLIQLRQALLELDDTTFQEAHSDTTLRLSHHFTRDEIDVLTRFAQQGFRISVSQLKTSSIEKIANNLPDVYKQLEIRLQRG